MSAETVVFKNAVILVNGASMAAQCKEVAVTIKAEMLDRTGFGESTRNHRGGLLAGDISVKGMSVSGANLVEDVLTGLVGATEVPVCVFPDGVVEGGQTKRGFAMMGVAEHMMVGGAVGILLPFEAAFQSAGVNR